MFGGREELRVFGAMGSNAGEISIGEFGVEEMDSRVTDMDHERLSCQ